jgi:hypothetical protein
MTAQIESIHQKNVRKEKEVCCPKFDAKPWHEQFFQWENKKFVKAEVQTFMNIPLNFGRVIKKLDKKVRMRDGRMPDGLCLSDHHSKWRMDIYLAVDRDIPGAEMTNLSGTYFSKVYEGDFRKTKEWCADFAQTLDQKGLVLKKQYMWYTTCPSCAKKYGKNYVVLMGEVE